MFTSSIVQTAALKLVDMENSRKQWENTAYRTSNQQLYAVLADCLAYGGELETAQAQERTAVLADFFAARGYAVKKDSPLLSRIVKAVFGNVDRRRISTYSLVLRGAKAANVLPNKLADWIEERGGIQEIKLSRSATFVSPSVKAATAKKSLSALPNLARVRFALRRSAHVRIEPVMSARVRLAELRLASTRFAQRRSALMQTARWRSAPVSTAPEISALRRFASERSAPDRLAQRIMAPDMSALRRLAPTRDARVASVPGVPRTSTSEPLTLDPLTLILALSWMLAPTLRGPAADSCPHAHSAIGKTARYEDSEAFDSGP